MSKGRGDKGVSGRNLRIDGYEIQGRRHTVIIIEIPGREPLRIDHVVLDYNGTVAVDNCC